MTYVAASTCPVHCSLRKNGCYAACNLHTLGVWNRVPREGVPIPELCKQLKDLVSGEMFRWGVAGDLPGDGYRIHTADLLALARSVKRLKAWAYTHYLTPPRGETVSSVLQGNPWLTPGPGNLAAIVSAQAAGLTVNLSAENVHQADELADLGVAPVVTILPRETRKRLTTPAGRRVRICPASEDAGVTCSTCGYCSDGDPGRDLVGFPAHGLAWKRVDALTRALA